MAQSSLEELVKEWLRLDKNEETRKEIQTLWGNKDEKELEKRLRKRIEFGTAGLRGRMEAGFSRMNDLTIIQASQGLSHHVLQTIADAKERGVVIGHDHRHHSEHWARLTASVFVASGVKAYLHRGLVHTPIVPFSVKKLGAACGVMITASHNPKNDNGYKVYWENAVQIIAPHDAGISRAISENLEPKQAWNTVESVEQSALCIDKTIEMIDAYFLQLLTMNRSSAANNTTPVTFTNTSMHGVSDPFVTRAFELFGFSTTSLRRVEEQRLPDPDFPTVPFPNPEEKGALDLALKTAEAQSSSYVLAQDPDSDRFSAAERSPDGSWTTFTGDQLGTLFAGRVFQLYKSSGGDVSKLAMVASTVSSRMVQKMAEVEGFRFAECLTGFKYIGNTALDLVKEGYTVPFGYEEAIGYMFGSEIRDKDGVAATMNFAEMVVDLDSRKQTVKGYLEELYSRYGYHKTNNSYFICNDQPLIAKMFTRLKNFSPDGGEHKFPTTIAGLHIIRVIDLVTGLDTGNPPSYKATLPVSSGHMLQFFGQSKDDRDFKIVLTLRTSGTEPKIKYYLEGTGPLEARESVDELLVKVVQEIGDSWLEADKNGLGRP